MRASAKEPTFTNGERVHLKADTKARTWIVQQTYPSGSVQILKEGRLPSMYTLMNVLPTHLKREGDTP